MHRCSFAAQLLWPKRGSRFAAKKHDDKTAQMDPGHLQLRCVSFQCQAAPILASSHPLRTNTSLSGRVQANERANSRKQESRVQSTFLNSNGSHERTNMSKNGPPQVAPSCIYLQPTWTRTPMFKMLPNVWGPGGAYKALNKVSFGLPLPPSPFLSPKRWWLHPRSRSHRLWAAARIGRSSCRRASAGTMPAARSEGPRQHTLPQINMEAPRRP